MIITHCNGGSGYLPIRAAYAEGGYEVQSSRFAPGADEKVIERGRADAAGTIIAFVASPLAGFMTGATIDINGGRLLR